MERLNSCSLFYDVGEEELMRMLMCLGARTVSINKRCTVLEEGAQARYIGVVLSGKVQLTRGDPYGNRSILSEVGPMEVFGEEFAMAEVKSLPISVIAAEPTEVLLIESARVLHTCSNNCEFHRRLIYNLMRGLAEKFLLFHHRLEVTSKRTTREKLLAYLAIEAKRAGKDAFVIPFDRQELADYLEVDRSGLSAVIGKLQREGVLESKKNYFHLLG